MRYAPCAILFAIFRSRANFFMDDTEGFEKLVCVYLFFKVNMRTSPNPDLRSSLAKEEKCQFSTMSPWILYAPWTFSKLNQTFL